MNPEDEIEYLERVDIPEDVIGCKLGDPGEDWMYDSA